MPTKFRVRIALAAERDIEDIWAFIARDDVEAASRFIRRLEKQIDTLERFPERCPPIPENEILGTQYRHLLISLKPRLLRRAQLNGESKGDEASPLVASGVQTPFAILN